MSARTARLEELTEFILDGTHGSPVRTDIGVPVLSAQNVANGVLDYSSDRFTSEEEFAAFNKRISIRRNDVLLTIVGTIGRAAVVVDVQRAVFQRSVAIIRPKEKDLDSRYLFHITQSPAFIEQARRFTKQSTQAGIYLGSLKKLEIPLPPIDEQKRIAAILDKADQLRQKRRQAIALLDGLNQSIFLEMFGDPASNPKAWKIGRIGDLLESANYGTSGKAGAEGQFPILRMGNLTKDGQIDISDLKYIDLSVSERPKYTIRRGDLLFNRTNSADLVGKTAVFNLNEEFAFAGYLVRARTNGKSTPEYVSAYLNSACGKSILRGMAKSIVGMANINAKEMQNISIPMPPMKLQQQFSEKLERLEKMRQKFLPLIAEVDSLFASLQHCAFTGQL